MDQPTILAFTLLGLDLGFIRDVLIGTAGFIVALGLAIFIHELGHFLAAKLFKVPVERFVIGFDKEAIGVFPRCIWERKIGETTYGLSLVPLGGYVKMSGIVHPEIEKYLEGEEEQKKKAPADQEENVPDAPRHPDTISSKFQSPEQRRSLQAQAMEDMGALYKKPFWQKLIIYGAGVFMNLVLAAFAVAFLYARGFEQSAPHPAEVAWIPPDSAYANTELAPGDRILTLNGTPVEHTGEMNEALEASAQEAGFGTDTDSLTVVFELERTGDAEAADRQYTFETAFTTNGEQQADFVDTFFRSAPYVEMAIPNTPSTRAGIKQGDFILEVNGEQIVDWRHFRHIVTASPNETLETVVRRGEERILLELTPWEHADYPGVGQVGIVAGNPEKIRTVEPLFTALVRAPDRIYSTTTNYVRQLGAIGGKLVEGNVTAVRRELGGPVGIAQIAYRMALMGFEQWLQFLIILNVALAVMNILPFPVLDGGHIVFAFYEAVFRRPVPPKILVPILNGAVILILLLFVLITFNDVLKLFT